MEAQQIYNDLIFHIQTDNTTEELRALRNNYPARIFNTDFTIPARIRFSDLREEVKKAIRTYRFYAALNTAKILPLTRRQFEELVQGIMAASRTRVQQELSNILGGDVTKEELLTYRNAVIRVREYKQEVERYNEERRSFAAVQAEYRQKEAQIRQKPKKNITINVDEIQKQLMTWDNIWGVGVNPKIDCIDFNIGLCEIRMEESAVNSAYNNPISILLAPFVISVRIYSSGGAVVCSSRKVSGLTYYEGNAWCVHPHQLSDTPCFGSFGQTIIDAGKNGEVIALISSLIGFYSQYNSEDSAGSIAYKFYPPSLNVLAPNVITPLTNGEYADFLIRFLSRHSGVQCLIEKSKLENAVEIYKEYFNKYKNDEPILFIERDHCYSCENIINEADSVYYDSGDNLICHSCWDNYCSDCGRHDEDCICNDTED